ncbi:unnamed protein product [Rotaria socialis]
MVQVSTILSSILLLVNYTSLYGMTLSGNVTASATNILQCNSAVQCPVPAICAISCTLNMGPLCAEGKCDNGKCQIIAPCSEGLQCTSKNLTQCVHSMMCALCLPDLGPSCSQVTCENGLCKTISPCSIRLNSTATTTKPPTGACTSDAQCPRSDICARCRNGTGPPCASSKCVKGKCIAIPPCSEGLQCTSKNLTQCVHSMMCARCLSGWGPSCSQVTCEKGLCKTISPCSIRLNSTTTTTKPPGGACTSDAQCPRSKICARCRNGTGPPCASSKCVKGKCIAIPPCSEGLQCTSKNLTRCVHSMMCARCLSGWGPSCSQVTCEKGLCKTISPCSIRLNSTTTTTKPPGGACTSDAQCPRSEICARCPNGTGPSCTSYKCVNGKCIATPLCSQRYCKISTQCPYNSNNCANCPKGYAPVCEQPACTLGVCSVILPCSKRTTSVTNSTT